jgi:hypothetical protein
MQVDAGDSEEEVAALAWLLSQGSETADNPALLRVVEYAAKVLVRSPASKSMEGCLA